MQIRTVGVVGAGAMGAGIAQVALAGGHEVVLLDAREGAALTATASILERLRTLAAKGRLAPDVAEAAARRLRVAETMADLSGADLVVEAIVERLEAKQALFADIEAVVRPDAILATNTSSLPVAAIASRCAERRRVCGLHFFNPVPAMKLVEIVATPDTDPAVVRAMRALVEALGKTPVVVRDFPGFLVNLAGRAFTTEALHLLWEGVADAPTIDRIMRDGGGFRMGPFELMDLTGMDVNYPATMAIYEGFQHDPRLKTVPLHAAMVHAGLLGRKTGRGFHDYGATDGGDTASAAPDQTDTRTAIRVRLPEPTEELDELLARGLLIEDADGPALLAPQGEDATSACERLDLDPTRTVAVDVTALASGHLTCMAPPPGGAARNAVATALRAGGYKVEVIADSPGFVLQRIVAMIGNLGAEIVQSGLATVDDLDVAMKLAQNDPRGPIEWIDTVGAPRAHAVLRRIQDITGSDRYRPSLWLRRRAQIETMAPRRAAVTIP